MPKNKIVKRLTIDKAKEFSERFNAEQREAIKMVLAEFGIKNVVVPQAEADMALLKRANEHAKRQISVNIETIERLEGQNVNLHNTAQLRSSKIEEIQKIAEDWA